MATRLLCRFRVHLAKVLGVLVTQLLLDVGEADAGGLEGLVDDLLRARGGGTEWVRVGGPSREAGLSWGAGVGGGGGKRVMGAAGLIYGKGSKGDRGGGDGERGRGKRR